MPFHNNNQEGKLANYFFFLIEIQFLALKLVNCVRMHTHACIYTYLYSGNTFLKVHLVPKILGYIMREEKKKNP